jgi:hypothetical protein
MWMITTLPINENSLNLNFFIKKNTVHCPVVLIAFLQFGENVNGVKVMHDSHKRKKVSSY